MIPIRDVIPSRTTPRATLSLIALHAAAFVLALLIPDDGGEIVRQDGLAVDGAWQGAASLVLHGGWLPLALNLGALWLFGENVEDRFGHGRFLVAYLAIGSAALVAGLLAMPASPPAGASGAVAGVIASYLVLFPTSRLLVAVPTELPPKLVELSAAAFALAWFLLQFTLGIPVLTLLIGTAGGAAAARLLRRPERLRVEWWGP